MKKYRALVPVVMIVLMVASWYVLVSDSMKLNNEYNSYLSEARKYAESGITKYAIENYTKALNIKSDVDVYVEVAEYYKTQNKSAEYLAWCEEFFDEYPTEPKAYDCVLSAYLKDKNYESCYDILYTASKRNVSSKYINEVTDQIKYEFKIDFNSYEDVGIYSNNYSAVKSKGLWGFVDRFGNLRVSTKYNDVGAYTKTNFVSVVNSDDDAYFIDKTGSKVLVSKEKYKRFGLLVDGIIAAQKSNEKYSYIDQDFKVLFGEYDFASTMNNGIAVVKNGNAWQIINSKGEVKNNTTYLDVKLDEKNIAYRNDRLFVSNVDGQYIMIDSSGKQIGKLAFEDARVFASEEATAVKMNGKWCFINKDGDLISENNYDEARSFTNGIAAVKVNGKWGFVDSAETVVIEPQFFGAKDFNEKGSCFVQTGDKWQLLKLYRLNRED